MPALANCSTAPSAENKADVFLCGLDEAGRGPLAGPVVASAVILPDDFPQAILNDSKKLSAKKRGLAEKIMNYFACILKKLCYNCPYLTGIRRLAAFFAQNSLQAVQLPHPAL